MPTYDYKCDACGHTFEQFASMSAKRIKKCPVCGKNKVRRLIGAGAGLIFKGSGFYITDYRDQGYKDKAKADVSANPATKADGKPESKPTQSKVETKSDASATATTQDAAKPASTESSSTTQSGDPAPAKPARKKKQDES